MLPNPLHPAVVHIPLALAVILPLIILFALVKIKKNAAVLDVWLPVVIVSFVMFAGALLATNSGQEEEEIVERVVSERVIEEHEEKAEVFTYAAGVLLVLAVAGVSKAKFGTGIRGLAAVGSIVVLVLAIQTGHLGGELVYKHGAASAERPAVSEATSTEHSQKQED